MSLVRKTYKCKFYARAQTYVNVNGKTVLIEFKSARRNDTEQRGTFTTAVPDLIKAIENDSEFNKLFVLDHEEVIEKALPEVLEIRENPLDVKRKLEAEDAERKKVMDQLADKDKELVVVPVEGKTIEETVVKKEGVIPVENVVNNPVVRTVSKNDVTNVQQAKDWLKNEFPELTFKQLSNKDAVLVVAKEKAIVFEALS